MGWHKKGKKTKAKSKTDGPMTEKKVVQIAKRVNIKQAETKQFQATNSYNMTSDSWKGVNLIYPMSQGYASTNLIGEKIFLRSITVKALYITDGARTSSTQYVRLALIKAKKDFTNSSATLTASDIVKTPTAATSYPDIFDTHKISVLRQYKRILHPNTTSGTATSFEFSVPIGKNEYWQSDGAGYLKSGNYYLVLNASDASGINTTGNFFITYSVNFVDE